MGMRRKGERRLEDVYFIVNEPLCTGHEEARQLMVREYAQSQNIEPYDDMNRDWLDVIVKKRSPGPTGGVPSARSFQLYFPARYDPDNFCKFTQSAGFNDMFELPQQEREARDTDDEALRAFGMRFLKQVLFGEQATAKKPDAGQRPLPARREAILRKHAENVEQYRLRAPRDGAARDIRRSCAMLS